MSPRFRSKSAAIAPFGFIGSWIVGSGVTSTRQPVATAAPSAQAVNRRASSSASSRGSARREKTARGYSGVMFGCSPPFAMIPWARAARERERAERHGQGHPRACARGRDDVVAAGVADAGQRVVLGHDRDRRSGPSAVDRRAERRGEPAHGALDPGAVLGEELGEPRVRLLFLERELRMVVDSVGEGLELVREAVDGRGDPGLERVDRAAHHNGCREAGTRRGWRAVGTAWVRPANTLSVATPGVTLTP